MHPNIFTNMSHNYPIYSAIRRGFPLSRMSTNNKISPLQFCCNTSLPILNNPKCLDLSYKTDLDFWNCFGRKITPSYNRRNTVWHVKPVNSDEPMHLHILMQVFPVCMKSASVVHLFAQLFSQVTSSIGVLRI